jgi:predicted alpha/beta-fold hydrolase
LQTLKAKAEREHVLFPGYFDIEAIRACDTIGAFDDAYIARIYGFRDKAHYYRSSGSKWWLNKIRVPAVAMNARDDPFILESTLPTEEDVGDVAPVRLVYHKHGGHCGFYTAQERMGPVGAEMEVPSHGWLAEELARAIDHIHEGSKV